MRPPPTSLSPPRFPMRPRYSSPFSSKAQSRSPKNPITPTVRSPAHPGSPRSPRSPRSQSGAFSSFPKWGFGNASCAAVALLQGGEADRSQRGISVPALLAMKLPRKWRPQSPTLGTRKIGRTEGGRDGFPSSIHRFSLWLSCRGPFRTARRSASRGQSLLTTLPACSRGQETKHVVNCGSPSVNSKL